MKKRLNERGDDVYWTWNSDDIHLAFDLVRPFEKQSVCVRNKEEEQDLNVSVIISAVSNLKDFKYIM